MSSFFKTNKTETDRLRDLIWYFSFGNTALDKFYTNGNEYKKTNNIHKLAEALDRNPANKFQFNIELPGSAGIKINCDYELPEMIELPWNNTTSVNLSGTFATYKNTNAIFDSIRTNKKIKPLLQQNIDIIPLVDNKWYFLVIVVILITEWLLRKYWMAQ
jgi:hypothetical protein